MSSHPPEDEAELIELIRAVDVRAPERLHRRTEALLAGHSGRAGAAGRSAGGRLLVRGSLAALAAVAIVLALLLSSSGAPARLSVQAVAAATLRAALLPAPGESAARRGSLAAAVEGVSFPYWEGRFGWRASGARSDRVAGRLVRTVFYGDDRGRRVGYAILAGSPPPALAGGVALRLHGSPYRLLDVDGGRAVVWLRDGHLCVVAGRGVAGSTLLALAGWREPAA